MAKLITIPLFVLFCTLIYFFFEVPILKGMVWATGDGMVNSWAVSRLLLHDEDDKVGNLTRAQHPKTRYFALIASHQEGISRGLEAVPDLISDPSWEVRVEALRVAKARKLAAAGPAVIARLESGDRMGAGGAHWSAEKGLLIENLTSTASPLSADGLARMAITTGPGNFARQARKALWTLGPVPQAVEAYTEILENRDIQRPRPQDIAACLRAAAVLDLPGALGHLTTAAREGQRRVQYAAIKGLGDLGGEKAKRFLEPIANPPEWARETSHSLKRKELARRALERIRRKELGQADIADEPEEPVTVSDGGDASAPDEPSVDDLLASYGSDAEEEDAEEDGEGEGEEEGEDSDAEASPPNP